MNDAVNHPKHYTNHPSGIECIDVAEHMGFNLGNAVKYCWRCDLKADAIEDLEKAVWYINKEIAKRKRSDENNASPRVRQDPVPRYSETGEMPLGAVRCKRGV